jgi:alpha-L-arabinofuranosidase
MPRTAKYFVGEYAVVSVNESDVWGDKSLYPTLQGAVAEAAYMTGMWRNSDIVFAASCELFYGEQAAAISNN